MGFARPQVLAGGNRWLRLFLGTSKGEEASRPAGHASRHQHIIAKRTDFHRACDMPPLLTWAESFMFAGGAALLLLLANLFSQWWYLSFFALTPFLYRIIKAAPGESLRLGFLFGLPFFGVSVVDSLAVSPLPSVLKLVSGTALFALFGWSVGWARQRWGFNPALVALLWVGLEMGLVKLGLVGGFLGEAGLAHPFLHSLIGLFGFLAVSAIIVLLNSLLVLVIVRSLEVGKTKKRTAAEDQKSWNFFFTRNFFAEKIYLVPPGRAPPLVSC
jgi:hypothetical protein